MEKKTPMQKLIEQFKSIQKDCKTMQEIVFFDGVIAVIQSQYLDLEKQSLSPSTDSSEVSDEEIMDMGLNYSLNAKHDSLGQAWIDGYCIGMRSKLKSQCDEYDKANAVVWDMVFSEWQEKFFSKDNGEYKKQDLFEFLKENYTAFPKSNKPESPIK